MAKRKVQTTVGRASSSQPQIQSVPREHGFNGYKNYATYTVCTFIDGNEPLYDSWFARSQRALAAHLGDQKAAITAIADELQESFAGSLPHFGEELRNGALYTDLLTAAFSDVDWREVAKTRTDE